MRFDYCLGSGNGTRSLRLVILSSLALFAVVVAAQNDFGEETSGPKGDKAIGNADGTGSNGSFIPTRNEQVSVPIQCYRTSLSPLSPFEGLAQILIMRPRMWIDTKVLYVKPLKYCQVKIRFAF